MGNNDYDYIINILVLGEKLTGKSSLIESFIANEFQKGIKATTGEKSHLKNVVNQENNKVQISLIDTFGGEQSLAVFTESFKRADGILFVYDITVQQSLKQIEQFWIKEVKNRCEESIPKILIGNKIDLENRQIPSEQGKTLAEKNQQQFFEVSAKNMIKVKEAIEWLANKITVGQQPIQRQGLQLAQKASETPQEKSSSCC